MFKFKVVSSETREKSFDLITLIPFPSVITVNDFKVLKSNFSRSVKSSAITTSFIGHDENLFKNIFTNAWNGVKAVFSTGGKIFDGIKDGIVKGFKAIVNAIIGGINKVIKVPFDGINTALNKIRNVNILGAKPFKGLISTIKVPQIPKLNIGTNYVPDDMLAMIHKGEAVIPKKFNPYASPSNSMYGAG